MTHMTDHRGSPPPPAVLPHPSSEDARGASERGPGRRRGPWRWLVALAATALLVVSGSGLVAFAQTGGGPGVGPSFLPAGAPIYVEIRADLPAGQREALAQMMANFPGFADAANFDMKVDAALDEALRSSSDQAISWTADIKPWLAGDIAFGIAGDLADMEQGDDPPMLVGAAIADPVAFEAFLETQREATGSDLAGSLDSLEEETYQGARLVTGDDNAYAVTGDLLIIAEEADLVRQALDVLAGASPSLAADPEFQTAFARVPDARLGAGYIDMQALRPLIEASMQQGDDMTADPAILELLPVDMTWYAAARPDGATFEAFVTPAASSPTLTVGESALDTRFPASTQVYLEARALGTSLATALEAISAQMGEEAAGLDQMGAFLGSTDGLGEALAWADDFALGAALDDTGLWLGVGIEVTDQEAADQFVTGLLGLARMFAVQEDSGVTVTETDVAGVTVTTISVDAEGLQEELPLPVDTSLSVALDEGLLLLGIGDFVAGALEQDADTSLAGTIGYRDALVAVGTPNLGFLYASITGVREGIGPMLPLMVEDYEEVRPFIEPFDRLAAASGVTEEGVLTTTVMLFLR
jgi:hypothetical protein